MILDYLISRFLAHLQGQIDAGERRRATYDYYEHHLRWWQQQLPIGVALIGDLTREHLAGGRCRRWHVLQAVQRLFNWAIDEEMVVKNPFKKIQLPPSGGRTRVLTRLELARFIRGARRPARWILVFMRHTLARPGEIRALRWRHYREVTGLKGGELVTSRQFTLDQFKAKDRRRDKAGQRVIPVDAFLGRILRIWHERRQPEDDEFIFQSRGGPWTTNGLRLAAREARRRARLDRPGGEAIVAYTIRHTMATQATLNGVRDRLLADVMGHASTRTTARYQHVDPIELSGVIEQAVRHHRRPQP